MRSVVIKLPILTHSDNKILRKRDLFLYGVALTLKRGVCVRTKASVQPDREL